MQKYLPFLMMSLLYSATAAATTDIDLTKKRILEQRQGWFNYLQQQVLTGPPEKGSTAAEWDRQASNRWRSISGARYALADADQNQSADYVYHSFAVAAFGEKEKQIDIRNSGAYNTLSDLYNNATSARDNQQQKTRSIDFILKDIFQRGRPYQVINDEGNYKDNYTAIKGSSFPSGHTWSGFKQAAKLALIFPERGGELFTRAIQYGESRVIVGAHFPTDTIASRIGNYVILAQLLADDRTTASLVTLSQQARQDAARQCGGETASCLTHQSVALTDPAANTGYYDMRASVNAPRLTPDQLPGNAGWLLRLRFPWLTDNARRAILASTAYPADSLAGWLAGANSADGRWGLLDLPRAWNGPAWLYDTLNANQQATADDLADFAQHDTWRNDIGGPGRLIKNGDGALTLAGNDSFAGVTVNQGTLNITGHSRYGGVSIVNGGLLQISGQLDSAVEVNNRGALAVDGALGAEASINGGVLTGNGILQKLSVNQGGTVAPGHSIGTLRVTDGISFAPGSRYAVEISPDGRSDQLHSDGRAILNGGEVAFALENSNRPPSPGEVRALLGRQYLILSASRGIVGRFARVSPDYLFLGGRLSYQPSQVLLTTGRNDTPFASVARTANERATAAATDRLPAGNPLYEHILSSRSADEARNVFHQLSGQIHADVAAAGLDDSRYIREALNTRLRQATGLADSREIRANADGAWAQLLGGWGDTAGDDNASGYHSATTGVLLGLDGELPDATRLGVATGYSRSSLYGGDASRADSDNYHLAVYGGKSFGGLALRSGASYSWQRISTSRQVSYGAQRDRDTATYSANTQQLFTELGYPLRARQTTFEPFASLAWVNFRSMGIDEAGGVTALHADKQNNEATFSTLGLRADTRWQPAGRATIALHSELGWQHQYGERRADSALGFSGSAEPFVVSSAPAPRDGLLLKASAGVMLNANTTLSLGYSGLLAAHRQDNSANIGLSLRF